MPLVLAIALVYGLFYGLLSPTLNAISEAFSLTYGVAGLLATITGAGFLVGSLFGAAVVQRFDIRTCIRGALLSIGLALLAIGLAPTYALILVSVAVLGVAAGVLELSIITLIAGLQVSAMAAGLNRFYSFLNAGELVAPIYAGLILSLTGLWRPSYILTSGLCLLLVAAARHIPFSSGRASAGLSLPEVLRVLRPGPVVLWMLVLFLHQGSYWGVVSWLSVFFQRAHGHDPLIAASAISFAAGAAMVSRYIFSARPIAWTARRLVQIAAPASALIFGLALALKQPFVSLGLVAAGAFVQAPVFASVVAHLQTSSDSDGARVVSGLALFWTAAGATVGPLAIGVVAGNAGIETAMIGALAVLGPLAAGLLSVGLLVFDRPLNG